MAGLERHPHVAVLSDEIYGEMLYEGTHTSLTTYPQLADRLILLDGWSKTYAMTGWRLGYGVWPQELVPHAERLAINCHSCVNASAQYRRHRRADRAARAGRSAWSPPSPSGAPTSSRRSTRCRACAASIPAARSTPFPTSAAPASIRARCRRGCWRRPGSRPLSGTSFGAFGEGYLRLSYAASLPMLGEAVRRIGAFLERAGVEGVGIGETLRC